jgi:hypothetical protein
MKEVRPSKDDSITRMYRKFSTPQVKLMRICTETGSVNKIHKLLRKNLQINVNSFVFEDGKSMLQHAVYSNHFELVIYLIERYKADVNFRSKGDGDTAMHIACRQGLFDIVCYLVNNAAADVSGENSAGETPLNISSSSDKTDATILRRFILRSIDLQNEAAEAQYFVTTGLSDMTVLESFKKSSKNSSPKKRTNSLNSSPNKVNSNVECDTSSKPQIEKLIETIDKQRLETEEMENAKISIGNNISHLQNEIENINIRFFEVTESKLVADSSVTDFSNEIVIANKKLEELAYQKIVLERHVIDTQIQVDKMKIESDELDNTKSMLAKRYTNLQTESDREKAQLNLLTLDNNRMDSHLRELNEQTQMKREENIVKIRILTEELM